MRLEKRITYYVDGEQLWTYKDLATKHDISHAVVRRYLNDPDVLFTRPREVARTGSHAQSVVLFNAKELDAWFAPQARIIRDHIERGRGRPRKK
jgi:hypothetical protein